MRSGRAFSLPADALSERKTIVFDFLYIFEPQSSDLLDITEKVRAKGRKFAKSLEITFIIYYNV